MAAPFRSPTLQCQMDSLSPMDDLLPRPTPFCRRFALFSLPVFVFALFHCKRARLRISLTPPPPPPPISSMGPLLDRLRCFRRDVGRLGKFFWFLIHFSLWSGCSGIRKVVGSSALQGLLRGCLLMISSFRQICRAFSRGSRLASEVALPQSTTRPFAPP